MADAVPTPAAPTTPTDTPEAPKTAADTSAAANAPDPKPEAKPAEKAPEPRRLKLKVDGQELELDEGEVIRRAQKASAVERKLEEIARARKELEEREAKMKAPAQDPRVKELTLKHGWTEEDAAAFLKVQDLYAREQQTPEQRALADERKRREELEQKLQAEEKAKKDAALQAEIQAERQRFEREIPAAAEKAGLPKTPHAGRLMVDQLMRQQRSGLPLDFEDAAISAKETLTQEVKAILGGMSEAQLESYLGEHAERLRKHWVAKVKGDVKPEPPPAAKPNGEQRPKTYLSPDEWRKSLGIG